MDIEPRPVDAHATAFKRQVYLHHQPDECPVCHRHVVPEQLYVASRGRGQEDPIEVSYRCTNLKCQALFIGHFRFLRKPEGPNVRSDRPHFILSQLKPLEPREPAIPDLVGELSPGFASTYGQALAAEAYRLDQIAGIGLRKALEFLVKDYASSENPDDEAKIEKLPLSSCIEQYVSDPNVKSCAKRASWLGNDETHYVRRWKDKDIEDLKVLIRLSVNWLENVLLTAKYEMEMPE